MSEKVTAVGLDFGTTNTVITTINPDGERIRHRFATGTGETRNFRSLICYWQQFEGGRDRMFHQSGPAGIAEYVNWGADQRLIMSMKSYLGDATFNGTNIYGSRYGLTDIISDFLSDLKEQCLNKDNRLKVVAGRPVVFAGVRPNELLALGQLREAMSHAGFDDPEFVLEPAGAGYHFARSREKGGIVLVADFGGGTSDFSLLRLEPGSDETFTPLAHSGIGIAGDRFDSLLLNHAVAPWIGKDSLYESFGKQLPVPWRPSDLVWHRIAVMNNPKEIAYWEGIERASLEPEKIGRLLHIIREGMGFQLYQAVAGAKERLSTSDETEIDLTPTGLDIYIPINRSTFETLIAEDLGRIRSCVADLLDDNSVTPDQVDHVFLTGGTSGVPAVRGIFTDMFGASKVDDKGGFTDVADGLAEIALEAA